MVRHCQGQGRTGPLCAPGQSLRGQELLQEATRRKARSPGLEKHWEVETAPLRRYLQPGRSEALAMRQKQAGTRMDFRPRLIHSRHSPLKLQSGVSLAACPKQPQCDGELMGEGRGYHPEQRCLQGDGGDL